MAARLAMFGVTAGVTLTSWVSVAQSPTPAFEVASVKENRAGSPTGRMNLPGDRFEASAVPLRGLIALAYGDPGPPPRIRPNDQIVGGPAWVDDAFFDIAAKTSAGVPPGPAGVGPKLLMLRSLLAERFKLTVHFENRSAAAYALVLAHGDRRLGPQLLPSEMDCRALLLARGGGPPPPLAPGTRPPCRADMTASGILSGGGLTMADFASRLSRLTNRIVLDRTGLGGAFDVDLQFNPASLEVLAPTQTDPGTSPSDRPALVTALQEQLGLKLQSTTSTVEVLVIDAAQRPEPD